MLHKSIQKIFDLLKINIQDIVKKCGVSERTIYRWFRGDTVPDNKYRHLIWELVGQKIEQKYDLHHDAEQRKGVIRYVIDSQKLIILHAEPYIHPLFKCNILGKCIGKVITSEVVSEKSLHKLMEIILLGNTLYQENCNIHQGILRTSGGSYSQLPQKSLILYQETWYIQFELPEHSKNKHIPILPDLKIS